MKALYKYPQAEFPYDAAGRGEPPPRHGRSRSSSWSTPASSTRTATSTSSPSTPRPSPDDILIRITVANRGPEPAHAAPAADALVPQHLVLGLHARGLLDQAAHRALARTATLLAEHVTLGPLPLSRPDRARTAAARTGSSPRTRPTPSGSSASPNQTPYVKDAFHEYVVDGRADAVNPDGVGTKAAAHYRLDDPGGEAKSTRPPAAVRRGRSRRASRSATTSTESSTTACARPTSSTPQVIPAGADGRGATRSPARPTPGCSGASSSTTTSSRTGSTGDPEQPPPPRARQHGRNADWPHLSTATSSRCPTSGSTPGTRPGTWPFT